MCETFGTLSIGAICGFIAFYRSKQLEERVRRLSSAVESLRVGLRAVQPREPQETAAKTPEAAAPQPTRRAEPESSKEPEPALVIEEKMLVPSASLTPVKPVAPAMPPPLPQETKRTEAECVENIIGKRLTWVGLGILFLGLTFFAKFAYDQGWFGRVFPPAMRIVSLLIVAIGMLGIGARLRRQGLSSMGSSLLGGGLGVAYLAIFAGFSPALSILTEPIFAPTTAFLAMAGITAAGMALAVILRARSTAIIAVIGGFVTPLLVSTGQNSRDALFIYMLILDLGVLAVALYRQWRVLDVVTFLGTAVLFMGWFDRYYGIYPQHPNWATLAWLGVFHLLFLGIAFAYHWRTRSQLTLERFVLVLGNLAWGLGYSAWILRDMQSLEAVICAAMATVYAALGQRARRIEPRDARIFHAFTAIAAMLIALAILFQLPTDTVAAGWFVEAVALLYLGYRFNYQPTRWCALLVLAAATARTLARTTGHHAAFTFIWNPVFTKLAFVPIALAAFAAIHRWFVAQSSSAEKTVAYVCGCASGLILLTELHYEIVENHRFSSVFHPWPTTGSTLSFLWSAGALVYLGFARWRRDRVPFCVALIPWAVSAVLSLSLYLRTGPEFILFWNRRFATAAALCAIGAAASYIARRGRDAYLRSQNTLYALTSMVQICCFVFASIEIIAWSDATLGATPLYEQLMTWLLALLWLAGGLICVRYGKAIASLPSLLIGSAAIGCALAASLVEYAWIWPSRMMFLNPRFALCVAVAAGLSGSAWWLRSLPERLPEVRMLPRILAYAAVTYLWLALTLEPPTWFHANITDLALAHRLGNFAVTLTWVIFASVQLTVGFLRRMRGVRMAALSLFGATVVKVLLIDMSGAQQLMRIASFIVTGVVLIAASYAYHRAEKHVMSKDKDP